MTKKNILNKSKLQKAQKFISAGKLDDAIKILTRLCSRESADASTWVLLASVYGRMNNFQGVGECCMKALSLEPNNTTAMNYLGNVYTATNQYEKAIEYYKKSLTEIPNNISTLHNLATLFHTQNKNDDALTLFKQVINLKPDHFETLTYLTKIYTLQGHHIKAIKHCQKLNEIRPNNYDLLYQLAIHYMNTSQAENARNTLEKCLQLTQSPVVIYIELAENELRDNQIKHFEKAEDYLKLALEIDPLNVTARMAQANIWHRQSHHSKALAKIERIISEDTLDGKNLIEHTALLTHYKLENYVIERGEALLKNKNGFSQFDLIQLHFSLGRIYDKQADYNKAFIHYQKANNQDAVKYKPENRISYTDATLNAYTTEQYKQLNTATLKTELPVFIIGMPRTGTTLVEQIISSHAEATGAGELLDIGLMNGQLLSTMFDYKGDDHGNAKELSTEQLNVMAQHYLDKLATFSSSSLRITDKMPHNFIMLGYIAQLFPQAKIIYCTRQPLDVILSIYFQRFSKTYDYTYKLEDIAHYYFEHLRYMKHWKETLNIDILDLPYDKLVNDFENTCHNLIDFIGLDWDESCLRFNESKRTVVTPSHDQVNKPIYTSSLERWKNYEDFFEPLKLKYPDLFSY